MVVFILNDVTSINIKSIFFIIMHPHIVEGIITWYYGSSMAHVMVGCTDYFPLERTFH